MWVKLSNANVLSNVLLKCTGQSKDFDFVTQFSPSSSELSSWQVRKFMGEAYLATHNLETRRAGALRDEVEKIEATVPPADNASPSKKGKKRLYKPASVTKVQSNIRQSRRIAESQAQAQGIVSIDTTAKDKTAPDQSDTQKLVKKSDKASDKALSFAEKKVMWRKPFTVVVKEEAVGYDRNIHQHIDDDEFRDSGA